MSGGAGAAAPSGARPIDPATPEGAAACIDVQCALVGLALAPAQREGVVRYFRLAAEMASQVTDFPLGPADESGSVFRPVEPGAAAAPADGAAGAGA